ncbi:MAG: NifB/NifX family molybdenum-iron cluster-binding protein [Bacteroidales bacterium]|nr:NifB/NifX family molybdenum-iron cluster-binding protein [Bacteroidales bacterium]
MRIAFTTKGTDWNSPMDPRFGRTAFFLIYDEEKDELIHFDNSATEGAAHGAGPKAAQKLFELKATVLITGNGPGGNAGTVLEQVGVKSYVGAGEMNVQEAYKAYKNNELKAF